MQLLQWFESNNTYNTAVMSLQTFRFAIRLLELKIKQVNADYLHKFTTKNPPQKQMTTRWNWKSIKKLLKTNKVHTVTNQYENIQINSFVVVGENQIYIPYAVWRAFLRCASCPVEASEQFLFCFVSFTGALPAVQKLCDLHCKSTIPHQWSKSIGKKI